MKSHFDVRPFDHNINRVVRKSHGFDLKVISRLLVRVAANTEALV
jgi:hypothetical protein